jgi:hypothetical protein
MPTPWLRVRYAGSPSARLRFTFGDDEVVGFYDRTDDGAGWAMVRPPPGARRFTLTADGSKVSSGRI